MLALNKEIHYVDEPFNIQRSLGMNDLNLDYWYTYIKEDEIIKRKLQNIFTFNYNLYEELKNMHNFKDFLRIGRDLVVNSFNNIYDKRVLMKDPLALMSTEWLYKSFNLNIIVMIRHPASFVSSLKKYNWQFPFAHFLHQKKLIEEKLSPFRSKIKEFSQYEKDIIDQAILLWKIIYYVVNEYRKKYDNWTFLKLEELASNPLQEFEKLYKKFNLKYSNSIKNKIVENSRGKNPNKVSKDDPSNIKRNSKAQIKIFKKRLSQKEISYIKEQTSGIWENFYTESDW